MKTFVYSLLTAFAVAQQTLPQQPQQPELDESMVHDLIYNADQVDQQVNGEWQNGGFFSIEAALSKTEDDKVNVEVKIIEEDDDFSDDDSYGSEYSDLSDFSDSEFSDDESLSDEDSMSDSDFDYDSLDEDEDLALNHKPGTRRLRRSDQEKAALKAQKKQQRKEERQAQREIEKQQKKEARQ